MSAGGCARRSWTFIDDYVFGGTKYTVGMAKKYIEDNQQLLLF